MKDLVIPLVVAVLGLVGAGLGAVVGARATRFGAERNAATVRRQVQDQGRVDHAHWLRQQRLNTYEGFLEAWDECLRITQESGTAAEPDSTDLDELRQAAVRMAERARRIALLGPDEVTHAAEELTATMQDDVEVSTQFIKAAQAATEAVDGRPVPIEAMSEATAEYVQRTQQVSELMQAYRDDGRDLRDLDGHPLLGHAMASIQQYKTASTETREALSENLEQLSATLDEGYAMVAALTRNKETQEINRERFTSSVRQTLGSPPLPE